MKKCTNIILIGDILHDNVVVNLSVTHHLGYYINFSTDLNWNLFFIFCYNITCKNMHNKYSFYLIYVHVCLIHKQ